jgi:lysophospholipase-2
MSSIYSLLSFDDPHIIEPTAAHTHTIIFLHGLGCNGPDFATKLLAAHTTCGLTLSESLPGYRWVFPSAKARLSSIFSKDQQGWFEISSLQHTDYNQHLQLEGLKDAIPFVSKLMKQEAEKVGGYQKVVLAGIDQGAATALPVLLCGGKRLGGFVGINGWMPFEGKVETILGFWEGFKSVHVARNTAGVMQIKLDQAYEDIKAVLGTPVFFGHGVDDKWVHIGSGEQAAAILKQMGMKTTWKEYEGAEEEGHWLKESEEYDDIVEFLESIM